MYKNCSNVFSFSFSEPDVPAEVSGERDIPLGEPRIKAELGGSSPEIPTPRRAVRVGREGGRI